jgi:hypothetical protein
LLAPPTPPAARLKRRSFTIGFAALCGGTLAGRTIPATGGRRKSIAGTGEVIAEWLPPESDMCIESARAESNAKAGKRRGDGIASRGPLSEESATVAPTPPPQQLPLPPPPPQLPLPEDPPDMLRAPMLVSSRDESSSAFPPLTTLVTLPVPSPPFALLPINESPSGPQLPLLLPGPLAPLVPPPTATAALTSPPPRRVSAASP